MRRNYRKDEVFALCKNLRQEYYINRPENFQPACRLVTYFLDHKESPFFLRDSISERNASARQNHPTREKRGVEGREKIMGTTRSLPISFVARGLKISRYYKMSRLCF